MKNNLLRNFSLLLLFSIFIIFILTGWIKLTNSEKSHYKRISKRIEEVYLTTENEFTSYGIYPLYDENDKLTHYLVEFEPSGFVYLKINTHPITIFLSGKYTRSSLNIESHWQRYWIVEGAGDYLADDEIIYETDENGNFIFYNESPFKVSNITNQKRYLLNIKQAKFNRFIPAIKVNAKYLNLISMEEFTFVKTSDEIIQPYIQNFSFIPKKNFAL